jgi:hypothetical protein
MSRSVYVSGFNDLETATKVADRLRAYHNERHHLPGKPTHHENLPEGHLVNILGECENGPTIAIPLYSRGESRSHSYDTVIDVMEVLRELDPEYNHTAEQLRIEIDAL